MGDNGERDVDELIRYEVASGIARLTIDHVDRGNALTGAMRDRLTARFEEASDDLAVRAVVVRGAGERHFCTGAALGGARPAAADRPRPEGAPDRVAGDTARTIRSGWQRLVAAVLDCEKPVVAAVNGTAAGGGAQLVLACDLVVMADTAKLVEVFVRRGIMPDAGGCYLLPRIIGLHRAKELLLLGDDCPAPEAERIGLANRVVPPADLDVAAGELAARLARLPTRALAMTKRLANRSFESSREQSFDDEAVFQELVSATTDAAEGLLAFAERRNPTFLGW